MLSPLLFFLYSCILSVRCSLSRVEGKVRPGEDVTYPHLRYEVVILALQSFKDILIIEQGTFDVRQCNDGVLR